MGSGGHQLCPSPCIHTYTHMYTQRHTPIHTQYTYTQIHTYTLIHINIYTQYTHTYTLIHTHTYHTHVHTYTHNIVTTSSLEVSFLFIFPLIFCFSHLSNSLPRIIYIYVCVCIYEFFSNLTSVPMPKGLRKQPEPEMLESRTEQRVDLSCAEHEDPLRIGGVKGTSGLLTWTASLLKEMAFPLTCKSSEPNSVTYLKANSVSTV